MTTSAASTSTSEFVPQYFEIREVGKHIKSSKLQYIWRFQLNERDVTVELFNSKMSSKKKIMINGQLKAEMKQKADAFAYQMSISGKRVTLQAVNEGFDLVYDGNMFQVLWEQAKRKNAFTWDNKNKRHDPFAVHEFGAKVDKVVAPTTREQGTKAAMELAVLSREQEERKNTTSSSPIKSNERKAAIAELEQEKKQIYNDLKSSLGESEAEEQLRQFMNGRYKKRMEEINRIYGKETQETDAERRTRKDKERKKRREEAKHQDEQPDFESGFDHGFESMATFNGKSVGKDEGVTAPSNSIVDSKAQAFSNAANPTPAPETKQGPSNNFDFNFDAPSQQNQPANNPVDLDDLLSGGNQQKNLNAQNGSTSISQNLDVFQFDNVASPQQNNVNSNSGASQNINNDPFGTNSASMQVPSQAGAQQQQPAAPQFVPNPMSHKQEQAQNMMMMQMQQMMSQQFQTNMMMQQQQMQGQNPFAAQMQAGGNPFMTNPQAMGQNAFGTFPQGQQMQQQPQFPGQQQPQFNQGPPGNNPFGQR